MKRSLFLSTGIHSCKSYGSWRKDLRHLSSPDVHSDHTITFRYYTRNAQKVSLDAEFLSASQPMIKEDYLRCLEH